MQAKTVKKQSEFKTTRQFTQLRNMIDNIAEYEAEQLKKADMYDKILEILSRSATAIEKVKQIEQVITPRAA